MGTQANQLLQSALSLPPQERAEIAASLIQSLDGLFDPEVDAAWAAEIDRRVREIDRGEVTLVPWDQVLRAVREHVNA